MQAGNHRMIGGVDDGRSLCLAVKLVDRSNRNDLGTVDEDGAGVVDYPASLQRNYDPAPDQGPLAQRFLPSLQKVARAHIGSGSMRRRQTGHMRAWRA